MPRVHVSDHGPGKPVVRSPLGEFPGASTPKELSGAEIEEILDAYGAAAARAIAAGCDGVEFHLAHGYLPWQFLSPLYNKRTDRWGGSYEGRLRFSLEALRRMRGIEGSLSATSVVLGILNAACLS